MSNENITNIKSLDIYFPKGDKRRGEALVLCAEAFLLGKESIEIEEKSFKYPIVKRYIKPEDDLEKLNDIIEKEVTDKMTFKEVETGAWKPENKGDEITGVLLNIEKDVGANSSIVYSIEVDNKSISVWGSTVLDSKMVAVKIGDIVKIIYEGLGEKQPGKNAPKLFKVLIDKE